MDWIRDLQKGIDYIETHLKTDMCYDSLPDQLFMSSYHFHRTFSLLIGMSVTDYIRKRRLSLAAERLLLTQDSITDIAYDCFYQTPESFSKAFTRFHGVSPSQCRKSNQVLKPFNRMYISLQVKGGQAMDYKIVKQEAVKLLAIMRTFKNEIINQEGNKDIPNFWQENIDSGQLKTLHQHSHKAMTYGICTPKSEGSKSFEYGIAVEIEEDLGHMDGFESRQIPAGDYAVFDCIGQDGACIGQVWEHIFSDFLVHSPYDMIEGLDYELYQDQGKPGVFCQVWIPVKVKS